MPPALAAANARTTDDKWTQGDSTGGEPLKALLILLLLTLGTASLALVPTAAADHCAEYPLFMEIKCEVYHDRDIPIVDCLMNTAPSKWGEVCLSPT